VKRIVTRTLVLGATVASLGAAASANAAEPQGWWVYCANDSNFPVLAANGQDLQFAITYCVNRGNTPGPIVPNK
jgi:hypothetical protein